MGKKYDRGYLAGYEAGKRAAQGESRAVMLYGEHRELIGHFMLPDGHGYEWVMPAYTERRIMKIVVS